MTTLKNVLHSSNSNEWYTPSEYIERVYRVMGTIDLDPASSEKANAIVDAAKIYTKDTDGLAHAASWQGKVFLNPPYGKTAGKSNQGIWSAALIEAYRTGQVEEAMMLLNAVPDRNFFKALWDFPICFVDHRIQFVNEHDQRMKSPTHPNAFIYLPNRDDRKLNCLRFFSEFSEIGHVIFSNLHISMGETQ